MIASSEESTMADSNAAACSRLLAFGDVEQHVDAADDPAFGIAQRRRIGHEPDALAVGTLGDGFRAADGAAFLEGEGHRTFIVRQRRAVGAIELPGHAPRIGAQLRHAAGKFDRGRIEVREPALGVGGVDRHRERVDHLAEATLALAQCRLGALQLLVVPLLGQVGDHQARAEGAFLQGADAEVDRHRRAVGPLQDDFSLDLGGLAVAQQGFEKRAGCRGRRSRRSACRAGSEAAV